MANILCFCLCIDEFFFFIWIKRAAASFWNTNTSTTTDPTSTRSIGLTAISSTEFICWMIFSTRFVWSSPSCVSPTTSANIPSTNRTITTSSNSHCMICQTSRFSTCVKYSFANSRATCSNWMIYSLSESINAWASRFQWKACWKKTKHWYLSNDPKGSKKISRRVNCDHPRSDQHQNGNYFSLFSCMICFLSSKLVYGSV